MPQPTRVATFLAAVVLLLAFIAPASAKKPNVLLIISDDLSAEALGCYGNGQVQSPHIDALAARGVRFDRAYCQFPVCGPSRAAMMSGMYCQSIGVTSNGQSGRFTRNMGDRPSMSQLFKRSGWYAARVSKIYHMRVPGDITAGVDGPDHEPSWTQRFNCQGPEWMTEGEHVHLSNENLRRDPDKHYGLGFGGAFYVVKSEGDGREQPDAQAAAKAAQLIAEHKGGPFFLAVGLVRPHVPLVAPRPYYEPYPFARMNLPPKIDGDWDDIPKPGISKNSRSTGLAGELDKQKKVLSAYYASVQFMDAQVGRVLAALDEHGLRDDTIVIFKSDHGYHLGEHDFWQKMSLHEESTRIPMILAPGKNVMPAFSPGATTALAEAIDLYPTLADLAGLDTPPHCQGVSLAPVLRDAKATVRDSAYTLRRNGHMLRTDKWAYIRYPDGSQELYDMAHDPKQYTNLAADSDHAETLAMLRARLEARLAEMK